jgi:hypothetical protein
MFSENRCHKLGARSVAAYGRGMTPNDLFPHVLQVLARAQRDQRTSSLDTLVDALQVRRGDVRRAVSALHREGLVDALRMRLSLRGFAIGTALIDRKLPTLRRSPCSVAA